MVTKDVTFQNKKGQALSGILRYPDSVEEGRKFPAVVLLHGFGESKYHDLPASLANYIMPFGYAVLRFDFHGHGESEGRFEDQTITQQIQDVEAAIDFLEELPMIDKERIAVIGTDLGGDIAILIAAQDSRVRCLVVQGARSNLEHHLRSHLAEHEVRELEVKGFHNHSMYNLRKDYLTSIRRHDILETLKMVAVPILIVHGNDDLRVPISEARQLFLGAKQPKVLEEVDGADHWFRQEEARQYFFELIVQWLRKWLRA
ncbi:alpha/beta fold hydrolase [Candidatus Woesearchaeota archaeon]|nr:alpha/beta fold hydrolase [Candidatus Woesearchaeota archaeon]